MCPCRIFQHFQLLVESVCNTCINLRNSYSDTPTHIAIKINDETFVKSSFKNSTNVNIQDLKFVN